MAFAPGPKLEMVKSVAWPIREWRTDNNGLQKGNMPTARTKKKRHSSGGLLRVLPGARPPIVSGFLVLLLAFANE